MKTIPYGDLARDPDRFLEALNSGATITAKEWKFVPPDPRGILFKCEGVDVYTNEPEFWAALNGGKTICINS